MIVMEVVAGMVVMRVSKVVFFKGYGGASDGGELVEWGIWV